MGYRSELVDRVFIVRWQTPPTLADLSTLIRELPLVRRTVAAQMGFCVVIPAEVRDPPEGAVRQAMERNFAQILQLFEVVDLLVPGEAVTQMLMRTVMRGLIAAAHMRGKMVIHATAEECFARLQSSVDIDAARVLREARALKLID
jgi:hypothetical protein